MKIRQDYVTNSSSSSFILAFESEESIKDFAEYCNEFDYVDVFRLVERLVNYGNNDREHCIELMKGFYEHEIFDKIIDKYIDADEPDYYRKCRNIKETRMFKEEVKKELKHTDFYKKKAIIDNSAFVVHGMVWDTDGGILEYAIRNGLLETEFRKWCVFNLNVG